MNNVLWSVLPGIGVIGLALECTAQRLASLNDELIANTRSFMEKFDGMNMFILLSLLYSCLVELASQKVKRVCARYLFYRQEYFCFKASTVFKTA